MTDLYYQKGLDALKQRDFETAILNFTEMLKIKKSSAAYSNRAFAYYYINKKDLSKSDFEESIAIIKNNLNNPENKDPVYADKYLIEWIRVKSSIAQINIEKENLMEAETDYFLIMGLYKLIKDEKLIPNDLHICHTYKNRGAVRYRLNKLDDAIRDIGAAYVEANSNDLRIDIVDFAAKAGITDEITKSIKFYSILKSKQ